MGETCYLMDENQEGRGCSSFSHSLYIERGYAILGPYPSQGGREERRMQMRAEKQEVLKRLNYIEGHLGGIRKMIEEDKYCVDILRQTYAVRKAIEKLEGILVESHLHTCVPDGIAQGRSEEVINELVQLYNLAGNR